MDDFPPLVPMRVQRPPRNGRGSSRADWIDYATVLGDANVNLAQIIENHRETITNLHGYIEKLEAQLAQRRPKGSRERLPHRKVERIKAALRQGQSMRHVAEQFGVSATTVWRYAKAIEG